MANKKIHTLQRRLQARRAVALLTASHACLGLANRLVGPLEFRTAGRSEGEGEK